MRGWKIKGKGARRTRKKRDAAPGGIDEIVEMWRDQTGDGDFEDTNEKLHLHTDAQGSVIAVANDSGTILEKIVYDVFGNMTKVEIWNGNGFDEITDSNSNGFIDADEYYTGSLTKNPYLFPRLAGLRS